MSILFLFLTLTAVLVNKNPDAILLKTGEQTKPEPGRVILNQENKPILNEGKQKAAYAVTISVNPVWEKQEKIALRTVRPEINYLKIFLSKERNIDPPIKAITITSKLPYRNLSAK